MKYYVIQDSSSGRYLNRLSICFNEEESEVLVFSYTGEDNGFEYFPENVAITILHKLQEKFAKYGVQRSLQIVEINDNERIKRGEIVLEKYKFSRSLAMAM